MYGLLKIPPNPIKEDHAMKKKQWFHHLWHFNYIKPVTVTQSGPDKPGEMIFAKPLENSKFAWEKFNVCNKHAYMYHLKEIFSDLIFCNIIIYMYTFIMNLFRIRGKKKLLLEVLLHCLPVPTIAPTSAPLLLATGINIAIWNIAIIGPFTIALIASPY